MSAGRTALLILACTLALAVGGCGYKGKLKSPSEARAAEEKRARKAEKQAKEKAERDARAEAEGLPPEPPPKPAGIFNALDDLWAQ